jgi:hypothetical protein
VLQDGVGVAQVGLDDRRVVTGFPGPGVGQHHGVVVDVDHPGRRLDRLRDLVHVAPGRQAGAEVEKLPDPGLARQEAAAGEILTGAPVLK